MLRSNSGRQRRHTHLQVWLVTLGCALERQYTKEGIGCAVDGHAVVLTKPLQHCADHGVIYTWSVLREMNM